MGESRRSRWYDVGWPVLAGVTIATGVTCAYVVMGLMMTAVGLALLELMFVPICWSVLTDLGYRTSDVLLKICPWCTIGSLALVGLVDAIGAWALLVGFAVLLTSPVLQGWRRGGVRGLLARHGTPATRTRLQFEEIVAQGFETFPDDEPPR